MSEEECALFDLQGYLRVDDVLSDEELANLNALLDARIERDGKPEEATRRYGRLLEWGEPYRNLIDHPKVTPYLEVLLGKHYRLDHDYLDVIRRGFGPIGATLHGGSAPFDPSQYYRFSEGRMHNGLTVAAYYLRDVGPGDGGFACVPGSHKSNLPFPTGWRDLSRWEEEGAAGDPVDGPAWRQAIRAVPGRAGSALFFTEALTHGTLPWRGEGERRTIFYKYSPSPISWSARYYNADDYKGITDNQRRILEPPNARYEGRY